MSSPNNQSGGGLAPETVTPVVMEDIPELAKSLQHQAKRYTSFVSVMKLALPALALILIAVVFLLPSLEKEEDAITLEYKKVTTSPTETRMSNPRFLSSDDGNQQYVVTADSAIQPDINSKEVDLTNLQADITLKTGQWLSMTAPSGRLNPDTGYLDLHGGIEIFSDNGNQIYAESAHVKLRERVIESKEGMKGHGPLGEFEADRLVAKQLNGTIRFEGNVKMILYP
ncbi:LPS export ABC transporter periplasmic protein LptC [Sneathiella aquimaris]|uniref:LPS export ABC transporter periplasmic protein LptC n=1 Tax=Sneathiella aquimaris TaxID=2599305 RepID=UPI00146A2B47|nr:LPS export ABC transporter periplasmic protein LptC [Sneathiella aquimaris]